MQFLADFALDLARFLPFGFRHLKPGVSHEEDEEQYGTVHVQFYGAVNFKLQKNGIIRVKTL